MTKTRPFILGIAAALLPLSAFAAAFNVPVDQARRVPFSGIAASVSPGNPAIADVNVIDERTILVVGKKAGVTNLIVLDRAGRTLFNEQVLVSEGDASTITVSRGSATSTYACSPTCQQVGGDVAPAPSAAPPVAAPPAAGK